MIELHHLNCVRISSPVNENVIGHCLLINDNNKLILLDTGIGVLDVRHPVERIGQELIDIVGYHFDENQTALRQIEKLGYDPAKVTDCIISHLDNDHIGGLPDFPNAVVHVGYEELESFKSGNSRYLKSPLSHSPNIISYHESDYDWFGFEARKINIDTETEIFLIPLFGHTIGHCGIALKANSKWVFYVGDAYYMRIELKDSSHPVNELARIRAEDNASRIETLDKIRSFVGEHPQIQVFCYHDIEEFTPYEH